MGVKCDEERRKVATDKAPRAFSEEEEDSDIVLGLEFDMMMVIDSVNLFLTFVNLFDASGIRRDKIFLVNQ